MTVSTFRHAGWQIDLPAHWRAAIDPDPALDSVVFTCPGRNGTGRIAWYDVGQAATAAFLRERMAPTIDAAEQVADWPLPDMEGFHLVLIEDGAVWLEWLLGSEEIAYHVSFNSSLVDRDMRGEREFTEMMRSFACASGAGARG